MPRKKKQNPTLKINQDKLQQQALDNNIQALRESLFNKDVMTWDVKLNDKIDYFDSDLSYELTGYRPLTKTKGLDFKPEWFTEAREVKLQTGKYCSYPQGTKAYMDFWKKEYDRCNNGMSVNGYRITGDHYFFLNYYRLPETDVKKAGQGRGLIFPAFVDKQYEYFHYIEMGQILKHDVLTVKSRGIGWSEIGASLLVNNYSTRRNTHNVIIAATDKFVSDSLKKAWLQLDFLNADTEGGMRHVRQKMNTAYHKKASKINKQREELPNSWNSDIEGLVIDQSSKLRGDRIDLLLYEEAGSNPILKETYIKGNALVEVGGNKIGTRIVFGTGGDMKSVDQLRDMFYNPIAFNILPYRHNNFDSGEYKLSGFFVSAADFILKDGYESEEGKYIRFIDDRGVVDREEVKKFRNLTRNNLLSMPKEYKRECAEHCFTAEEAFALEGENQFDQALIAEQMARILMNGKDVPTIQHGTLEYIFKDNVVTDEMIEGVKFVSQQGGKVHVLEAPKIDDDKQVPVNLYVAGIDGIDLGQEDTSASYKDPSDFCVVILRRAYGMHPPQIVAYYKDRPQKVRDAHVMCLRLLQWYNAKACLESTRISLLQFFRSKKCENRYLMRRPRACQSDIQNGKSRQFGAPANETTIKHGLDMISDYIDEYCGEIWFREILDELSRYSYENKRKFDIVAAMQMAFLANEELMFVQPKIDSQQDKFEDFGYWKDERGIIHKGRIPKAPTTEVNATIDTNIIDVDSYYGYERLRISSLGYY